MTSLHAEHTDSHIAVYRSGLTAPLVVQRAAPDHRPYIHPVLAPDGVGELTENEPAHHLWQHGLYVGLNDVNGVGFWTEGLNNSKEHDGTFHPEPLAPPLVAGDGARWAVVTCWRSPAGDPLLTETQRWSLRDRGDSMALDLEWELRAETDLRFGKYGYGGLFLRMPFCAATGGDLLTSEGSVRPAEADGERARGIGLALPLSGRLAGPAGLTVFDHPSNPEYPSPWRVDDQYGISPSRCLAGEWRLAKGGVTVSRYRIFAFVGGMDRSGTEAEWRRFSGAGEDSS